jgi:hypothetical protein
MAISNLYTQQDLVAFDVRSYSHLLDSRTGFPTKKFSILSQWYWCLNATQYSCNFPIDIRIIFGQDTDDAERKRQQQPSQQ